MHRVALSVVAAASFAACSLDPVPRLSKIERDDENGDSIVTEFEYDKDGHIVGVEKVEKDGDDEIEQTWTLTWEDRGFGNGTPLVRVEQKTKVNGDTEEEHDIELTTNVEARTATGEDKETDATDTVTSVDGNVSKVVSESDEGTSTTKFVYELGNLVRIDSEFESDEDGVDDRDGSIEIDYLSDGQENIGTITLIADDDQESEIELAYDDDGALTEQVVNVELPDGRDVTIINEFSYDDEGRIVGIEHSGEVDGESADVGESTFSYDEGEVTGVPPTPRSVFLLPLFDLKGRSSDNISSTDAETFLFPGW